MRSSAIITVCFVFLFGLAASAQTPSGDVEAQLLGPAKYSMPKAVADAGIDGKVMVGIHLDETGKPTRAWVTTGPSWPCGNTPVKALEELYSSLSDAMMKLQFSPSIKDGKPRSKDIGLELTLINPNFPKSAQGIDIGSGPGKPVPKQVMEGVLNGKAVSLPTPGYPAAAKENRDHGTVTVQVTIDEQGNILRAGALTGPSTLQFAARAAACGAKFTPTTLQGNPVKVTGVITYNFNL